MNLLKQFLLQAKPACCSYDFCSFVIINQMQGENLFIRLDWIIKRKRDLDVDVFPHIHTNTQMHLNIDCYSSVSRLCAGPRCDVLLLDSPAVTANLSLKHIFYWRLPRKRLKERTQAEDGLSGKLMVGRNPLFYFTKLRENEVPGQLLKHFPLF